MTKKPGSISSPITTLLTMNIDSSLKAALADKAKLEGVTLTTLISIYLKYAFKHAGRKKLITITKELLN